MTLASSLTPLLRLMEPERAHRLALRALRLGLAGHEGAPDDPILATRAFGLSFRNPIGLAAGFDKNAVAVKALARLGFGLVETGTVTPLPQPGNPAPRLFRLTEDGALVNRLGFNNAGLNAYLARIERHHGVPIGANVGINKHSTEPERDYPALVAAVAPVVDYIVMNVSSPNTPGLRGLQAAPRLAAILAAIAERVPERPPLLVKISPDLSESDLSAVVDVCVANEADGLIVSNTTLARPPSLRSVHAREVGGLSGRPLFAPSTSMLARTFLLARGRLSLVGVGGVASGEDALTKLKAGASLVQVYSAMIYHGPGIVARVKRDLAAALRRDGFTTLAEAVGVDAPRLAGGT